MVYRVMFARAGVAARARHEKRHERTQGQPSLALTRARASLEEMARMLGGKPLAAIVEITEPSDELQLVHRHPRVVLWRRD
jgi:hypothetical protein